MHLFVHDAFMLSGFFSTKRLDDIIVSIKTINFFFNSTF